MSETIAYCGIDCSKCSAFQATMKNDRAELERVAQKWSEGGTKLTAEDVTCEGCFGERLSKYARGDCTIRSCAVERKAKNCAYCDEYKCEKLGKFLQNAQEAAKTLETIHKSL